jgi:alpha-glucosidase
MHNRIDSPGGRRDLKRRILLFAGLLITAVVTLAALVHNAYFAKSVTDSGPIIRPMVRRTFLPPFDPTAPDAIRVTANGLRIEATAVDPSTFHIVIARDTLTENGPPSPFVVQTTPLAGVHPATQRGAHTLATPAGRLTVSDSGGITLQDTTGRSLLSAGTARMAQDTLRLTFRHPSGQRLYGSGNAGMAASGGLVHTSGVSAVGNGYTRIPLVLSTGGYGVLVANSITGIAWTDRKNALAWTVPGEFIDLYLMAAPDIYGLLDVYTRLTGRAPAPPPWTFGYMQSRWGYTDAADVREKWYRFRDLGIPVDAFIYDYDWFVDDWIFNPRIFPHPREDLAEMHRLGIKFIGIRKPRVHAENLKYAQQHDWVFVGADLRFDVPDLRAWWWSHHTPLVHAGVDGWWNDEAEAAYDGYFYMNMAESEGWRAATPAPFWSLSRAFAPGQQRFGGAVWTGDLPSSWTALQNQPGTMLNWGLCGMPYVGQDIGGFRGFPTPELYVRWMQEGALIPVMRAHGIKNSPRWPWSFGDRALAASRQAILLRYRLRPYLQACAAETARTGAPLMRPLFLEFPDAPVTHNMEHEWLLGPDLLAAPVLAPGGRSEIYFPKGTWRDFHIGATITGPRWLRRTVPLETIPLYIRVRKNVSPLLLRAAAGTTP